VRRNSFLGQVLTAVARSTPATNPVRDLTADTEIGRPASQLLTAIARTTPAFIPGSKETLDTRPRESWQFRLTSSMPLHVTANPGSVDDLIEFGQRVPSARQPRSYRQALVVALAALAIPIIVASTLIVRVAFHPRPAPFLDPAAPASSGAPPSKSPSALMTTLIRTNQSVGAKGLLPSSSCQQQGSDQVTCASPAIGITGVDFETFPSLNALYNAYMAEVAQLNSGQFKENFSDCGLHITYGEVAWNLSQHTKSYAVDQMARAGLSSDKAAGRVFCTYTRGNEYIVWTQNDGHLMGVVAGPAHENVWNWWVPIHHNIIFVTSEPDPNTAQTIAYNMMASFGFNPQTYFGCLIDLWNNQSGWRYDAESPSGSYGIPQALPGSKMASAGPDWTTNPATQIKWGLGYIKELYGNPCNAWAFVERNGYY
jgi:hypothetical protein